VKSFSFLAAAAIYDSVLYAYMYKVVEDPLQRANVLGQCSGLLTTFMMTLPAFEVVRK
jgi:hypothetical protein